VADPVTGAVEQELWRVRHQISHSPAHLVVYERDGIRAMACGWVLPETTPLLTRTQMIDLGSFVCINCASVAKAKADKKPRVEAKPRSQRR
jgi:hypothetical protein